MANLIVQWHPERHERILLCTHYDTRPFPDQRPAQSARHVRRRQRRRQRHGAADGAWPTRWPSCQGKLGVDFVLFDGEEFVFAEGDPYFLGSEYFATDYATERPPYRYRWAVLLDMVGDADLQIYPERNSMSWDDTRPLVEAIWDTAAAAGRAASSSPTARYDILRRPHEAARHRQDSQLRHHRLRLSRTGTPRTTRPSAARPCRWPRSAGSSRSGSSRRCASSGRKRRTDRTIEGSRSMDTFSACLAFGPLAIYLLLLGMINLQRRPLVISGTRETLSLGLALWAW